MRKLVAVDQLLVGRQLERCRIDDGAIRLKLMDECSTLNEPPCVRDMYGLLQAKLRNCAAVRGAVRLGSSNYPPELARLVVGGLPSAGEQLVIISFRAAPQAELGLIGGLVVNRTEA